MNIEVKNDEMLGRADSIYATKFYSMQKQIDELQQKNQQLKNRINSLQRELNDENLQCSKYAIDIQELKIQISAREENYKKLEDDWNKLKEFLETNWKETQDIWFVKIINKMKELERGVNK